MNLLSSFFGNLGKFWQNPIHLRLLRYSLVILLFQIALIIWYYKHLPPQIPLFFSRPWGSSWLAPVSAILILPLYSLLTILLNYFLAIYFHQKKPLLSQILLVFSVFISLIAAIAVYKIITLVT